MDITSARDWVIVILGILEIIFMIVLFILLLVLYSKINRLIKKGKETVMKIEHMFASPYLKAGSWLFKIIASGLGLLQKKET